MWSRCLVLAYAAVLRPIEEHTPFPCKEKYSQEEVEGFAKSHLAAMVQKNYQPRLLLLLGGSGSGKGRFLERLSEAKPEYKYIVHGLDEYLVYIPEYQRTLAAAAVYKDAADACYKPAAIPAAKFAQQLLIDAKANVVYEETGKDTDRVLKRVLPPFVEAGYLVAIVYVDTPVEVALARATDRFQVTGRYAAEDYVRGTFKNTAHTFDVLRNHGSVVEALHCKNLDKLDCVAKMRGDADALFSPDVVRRLNPTIPTVSEDL
jgi:chloramphenicol 3-O-phosphotransferase